jgi:phosphoglycerate kinase
LAIGDWRFSIGKPRLPISNRQSKIANRQSAIGNRQVWYNRRDNSQSEVSMDKKTVRDIDVKGKRVLMRVDFNVPVKDGKVGDDTRIQAAVPTINYLLEHGAAVVLMSHLGRPKGVDDKLRMAPVGARLAEILGRPVRTLTDCVGPEVESAVLAMKPGDVVLLENLRFHAEEEKNDQGFARQLARLGQVYVDDAFGTAHRAHASTEGVAHYLPAVAGLLMEQELDALGKALENPERPFVAILGGAKISDKIGVIRNLLGTADALLIGGGMANTFLKAQGREVGDSLVEDEALATAREILTEVCDCGMDFLLPVDAVVADRFDAAAAHKIVPVDQIPAGWRILDIGPRTLDLFRDALKGARLVLWNGPMGVFEFPAFAAGTKAVAQAVAESGAYSIVGGGDSVAALQQLGMADKIGHLSTGGGASLEFLEGKVLPGVEILLDR